MERCGGSSRAKDNYDMAIGFTKPDDYVIETDGYKIVVDPKSMSFLNGMQVDHYESIQSSGFKFNNPDATRFQRVSRNPSVIGNSH